MILIKAEQKIQEELEKDHEIYKDARIAVQQRIPESEWVEVKMKNWKADPDLSGMTSEQET